MGATFVVTGVDVGDGVAVGVSTGVGAGVLGGEGEGRGVAVAVGGFGVETGDGVAPRAGVGEGSEFGIELLRLTGLVPKLSDTSKGPQAERTHAARQMRVVRINLCIQIPPLLKFVIDAHVFRIGFVRTGMTQHL